MIHLDVLQHSDADRNVERRHDHLVLADHDRAVIVDWAGGMMDIGWAQYARGDLAGPATAFVRDSGPFSGSFAALLDALRVALTRMERDHRRYCTAGVVAVERGAKGWRIGRLGAMRCVGLGHDGEATVVGHEDALALAPNGPPTIVTAALVPTVRWQVGEPGVGALVLRDQSTESSRKATAREDCCTADTLVVLSHPLWTETPIPTAAGLTDAVSRAPHGYVVILRAEAR